mmetsp:Transcript_2252/g.6645  ORF Transcript_2252/g.6645 Transcript_2252/m.6645 type:complete len:184 (+) Transcript_2252:68-619(+)
MASGKDFLAKSSRKYCTARDVRYQSAPSFSFGRRNTGELNSMAANNQFFCKTGTHRCPHAEAILGKSGRMDKEHANTLKQKGQQWRTPPGPGAYRTPRALSCSVNLDREVSMAKSSSLSAPTFSVGHSRREKIYHTLGGYGHAQQHEGRLRCPTPRSIVPGPGSYSSPHLMGDFLRPQGHQAV